MFDFVNKQMEVSHPLCEECTDAILDAMDQQLKVGEPSRGRGIFDENSIRKKLPLPRKDNAMIKGKYNFQ